MRPYSDRNRDGATKITDYRKNIIIHPIPAGTSYIVNYLELPVSCSFSNVGTDPPSGSQPIVYSYGAWTPFQSGKVLNFDADSTKVTIQGGLYNYTLSVNCLDNRPGPACNINQLDAFVYLYFQIRDHKDRIYRPISLGGGDGNAYLSGGAMNGQCITQNGTTAFEASPGQTPPSFPRDYRYWAMMAGTVSANLNATLLLQYTSPKTV